MKTLLIMRHAKSSWDDPNLNDHDRPLNARGQKDAPRMGSLLKKHKILPDLIVSSTALRAHLTAEAVANSCNYKKDIQSEEKIYVNDSSKYLKIITHLPSSQKCVLIVGHNPSTEELIEELSGECHICPTAALAHFQAEIDDWTDLKPNKNIHLINFWIPKELKD